MATTWDNVLLGTTHGDSNCNGSGVFQKKDDEKSHMKGSGCILLVRRKKKIKAFHKLRFWPKDVVSYGMTNTMKGANVTSLRGNTS